jgi:hypothetical protein
MMPLRKQIRWAGLIGSVVALAGICADIALQYSPAGYSADFGAAHTALWRLLLGHYLGIFAIPLMTIGYWQVYLALKPAGKWFSLPPFLIAAYSTAYGAAFHGTFAAVALTVQARAGASAATQSVLVHLLNVYLLFSEPLAAVFLLSYFIFAVWFVLTVLLRPTLYPKWMALCNPFLFSLIITLLYVSNIVPIVGNLLYPLVLSAPHLIFFALSTIVLWNSGDVALLPKLC